MNYYLSVLKKYAIFSGRAQRAEYWYFVLFHFIIVIVLILINEIIMGGWSIGFIGLVEIYTLAVLIPIIAVTVRRLHDTNRSGWWVLIELIPIIGAVILIFMVQDSHSGQNQYGLNPKEIKTT